MRKGSKKLSFSTITTAASGSMDAINEVLAHYGGYIAQLSTRPQGDDNGNVFMVVDEGLRRRLEIKLITKILNFRVV